MRRVKIKNKLNKESRDEKKLDEKGNNEK